MLQFIIGTAGTGKTAAMTELASQTAMRESNPVLFLVPEQASFYYEKRMLQMLGARHADRVEVLSFSRLAQTLLTAQNKPPIDEGGKAVLMSMALEALSEKLHIYRKYAKSLSVANELLKLSAEFKRCMLPPSELSKTAGAMEDCFLQKKLSEIALILETYDALVAQSYSDDTDALTRLAQSLKQTPSLRGRTVFVDAFSGFTVQEYAVLEQILCQANALCVSLCTDSIHTTQSQYDPSAFAYVRRTAQKLLHLARLHEVHVKTPISVGETAHRFRSPSLTAVERIFATAKLQTYTDEAPQITVVHAPDLYHECAYTATAVKKLLREEGYRCREIAILFRDAGTYEAPMRAALAKCGVPVFEDKRQPILNQPLISLVRGLCAIASEGFSTEHLMQILKTQLLGMAQEDVCALENYALLWNIRGRQWLSPFTANPLGLGEKETQETAQQLDELNTLRARAVAPIAKLCADLHDTTGVEYVRILFRFLEAQQVNIHLKTLAVGLQERGEQVLAFEQERIWELLMEIFDMFSRTLGTAPVTPKRFAQLLDVVIQTCSLGNIPQGLDEVTVGDVDRTVTMSPRAVFVLGAQEGVFPRTPSTGGLLTASDRKQLKDLGLELYDFGEIKVSEERFLVYKTLCCAAERLTVSACSAAEDGSAQCGSEIVRNLSLCFPKANFVNAQALAPLEHIESEATAFEQLCLQSREQDGIYTELNAYFSEDAHWRARVQSLKRLQTQTPTAFSIENKQLAERLFGKNMFLSASRVESYYKCAFAYFCKFGLKAVPRKAAQFDAALQGTEIHFVLETLLREVGRERLLSMTAAERQAEIDKLLDGYLQTELSGAEQTKRFLYLYNRLRKTLSEILERLMLEFEVCRFVPVDFELKIDRDGAIQPYETKLPNGGSVQIKGSIDRVDKLELDGRTYIRVIDYKSGGKKFALSEVLNGLNMQMLLYLFAIWQNGAPYYGQPIVPAGILYVPAKAVFEKLERDVSDEDAAMKKAKSMRMNGMLLDDETILLGMDSAQSGCFIPVDKKGKSDSLISLHHLAELKKETERLVTQMAQNLQSGQIEAVPARIKGNTHVCDYCDYRSVCAREDDMPAREIVSAKHNDCLQYLDNKEAGNDAVDG